MKVALYIADGVTQVVLTPESDYERNALRVLHDPSYALSVHRGSFYDCQGGWTRYRASDDAWNLGGNADDSSTMLRLTRFTTDTPAPRAGGEA